MPFARQARVPANFGQIPDAMRTYRSLAGNGSFLRVVYELLGSPIDELRDIDSCGTFPQKRVIERDRELRKGKRLLRQYAALTLPSPTVGRDPKETGTRETISWCGR